MRSPPILHSSGDDADAETGAAQAREQGASVIRSHLDNHLDHNPGRSSDYVTWIATLHPENADVEVDQRFFIPGNPWWRIYEEQVKNQDIPSATAVAVNDVEEDPLANGDVNSSTGPPPQGPSTKAPTASPSPHFCLQCSPVDLFGTMLVALVAFLAVFITETLGLCFYFVAAFFYNTAQLFSPRNVLTGLFYSFFMIFYFSFALADSMVLFSSILTTEFCAIAAWLVSFVLGGILRANGWHQYVRRTCHLIRVGNRKPFTHPPRQFCSFCNPEDCVADTITVQPEVVVVSPSHVVVQQQKS